MDGCVWGSWQEALLYVCLDSVLNLLTFYQVFMIYRIFLVEGFRLLSGRITAAVGIAFGVCLAAMFVGMQSVLAVMLLAVLWMRKREVWECVGMLLSAVVVYIVLCVMPVIMVRGMVVLPAPPALLARLHADYLGVGLDVLGCAFLTLLYGILRRHKISLTLRPLEVLSFGLFFLFEIFLQVVVAVIRVHYRGTDKLLLNGCCLFFFLLALGAYLWHLITLRRVKRLNGLVKQEEDYIACQLAYLERYRNENQNIRTLRHDLRGHLQMLESLRADNQTRKTELYLDALQAETSYIEELEFTGNQAADIVLANRKERARELGIPFVCEGAFPWLDELTPMEVCSLLSNLLDNALEASAREREPDISVKGGVQEHFWTLLVSNRAEKECRIRNNRVASAKGSGHGMGLGIVERIVESYGGICSYTWENQRFYCRILFPRRLGTDVFDAGSQS
ncbi:MAG: GHKL domain-containing protein [Muribaculum sp.]|nr:GHKL domain-containing protein [Muribaculum sp.]